MKAGRFGRVTMRVKRFKRACEGFFFTTMRERDSKVLTMPGSSMSAWLRLRICMRGIAGREASTRCESGRAVAMRRESIRLTIEDL